MKNTYSFLRHGETVKDPKAHPKDWVLTNEVQDTIKKLIDSGIFSNITKIVSSNEPKAVSTGKPILEFYKVVNPDMEIIEYEEFAEVKREKKFLTDDEFLIMKQKELLTRDERVNGVESGNEALERFTKGILRLEEKYSGENILIITHGTILALYLADKRNEYEHIFEIWKNLNFCEVVKI